MKLQHLLIYIIPFLLSFTSIAQSNNQKANTNRQMSTNETTLFNLVNDIRTQNNKPAIPISEKLNLVAQTHLKDLLENYKPESTCSLHSWSNKGKWTSCCNMKDPSGINCMKVKPKEIADYQGLGFELIYWADENADPMDAYNLWKQMQASLDMIICSGKWKSFSWKTMGVAIDSKYAIVWFGDKIELITQPNTEIIAPKTEITAKTDVITEKPVEKITEKVNQPTAKESKIQYHIVISSINSAEAAKKAVKKYRAKEYPEAKIVVSKSIQRIVVQSFNSEEKARTYLNKIKTKFPDAWILKQ